MKESLKRGFSFGLTSGIITTLGLMVSLHSGTHSQRLVIGGILTIAIADALSDALGIHISEESENKHKEKEIWESTFSTFFAKLFVALTFVVPPLLFDLSLAIILSIIWGLSLLGIFSYFIAKAEKIKPGKVIAEHWSIAVIVIIITHYIGDLIRTKLAG